MKKLALVVSLLCANTPLGFAQDASVFWSGGTFNSNTILSLIGPPSHLVYAVNLGGDALVTANGYSFQAGLSPIGPAVTSGFGGTFDVRSPFLTGGSGLSTDEAFNLMLSDATFWNEPATNARTYIFNGLVVGHTYHALFLMADTREGGDIPGRQFTLVSGGVPSPFQTYAFQNADPFLGGYLTATFVANSSTQVFEIFAKTDSYYMGDGQLNGVALYSPTAVPEPGEWAVIFSGFCGLGVACREWRRRRHRATAIPSRPDSRPC